ncbi:histidine kinase dimerization/phospho-acceptor domain-containing protein [Roseisalinus antarcticus]|uniref:histidine kinase n=1 Tax=Roseisalinus antarcticus TaxID=254357 RepID=A0A1Y5TFU8_9RHOB|nr:histidine kinase dimerization/phospho-acceptor domain-containing protein [Roseisalinus antarcticus]SLN63038.1 Sensor protein QseC [Roseisalinus antarcticus]
MWLPRSLQARLGLSLGALLTLLWIAAATVTAVNLREEMDEIFDAALREAAHRLLPLAVVDILGREDEGIVQRLGRGRDHDELFSFVVRDDRGRLLFQSHSADPTVFPDDDGRGFRQTATHRSYNDEAVRGSIRITVAEPLAHRSEVAREIQAGLGLPLLFVIPIALLLIVLVVRASFGPFRRYRERLERRDARDLSPVPATGLPAEVAPIAATLNGLLARLNGAFDAERTFAANAAHEVRTPLAGAIAQAQRLQTETANIAARTRAADIETTLKRLTQLSERLVHLARAEGGRLRMDDSADLWPVARFLIDELSHRVGPDRIALSLPDRPVMSDLDTDAFGILCRTLVAQGTLCVANDGPVVPPGTLDRPTARFERGDSTSNGSGLGLAIVASIAERIGSPLHLMSPRSGGSSGLEATVSLPVEGQRHPGP